MYAFSELIQQHFSTKLGLEQQKMLRNTLYLFSVNSTFADDCIPFYLRLTQGIGVLIENTKNKCMSTSKS